ncbi:33704_t:CDS:2, partial [Gigaspora margarita]
TKNIITKTKEGYSIVNNSYTEQLDIEYDYRSKAKKVKFNTYNANCYNENSNRLRNIKKEKAQSFKTRRKSYQKEIEEDFTIEKKKKKLKMKKMTLPNLYRKICSNHRDGLRVENNEINGDKERRKSNSNS